MHVSGDVIPGYVAEVLVAGIPGILAIDTMEVRPPVGDYRFIGRQPMWEVCVLVAREGRIRFLFTHIYLSWENLEKSKILTVKTPVLKFPGLEELKAKDERIRGLLELREARKSLDDSKNQVSAA